MKPLSENVLGRVHLDQVVLLGHPVLERPASTVTEFDSMLRNLVDRMFDTMRAAGGIGLAAPQIGIGVRVAIIEIAGHDPVTLVNPEIVEATGEMTDQEGCLSIPGFRELVTRHTTVRVRAQSEQGHTFMLTRSGLYARAIQHEIDHLNGKLFLKYLSAVRERVIRRQFRREMVKK